MGIVQAGLIMGTFVIGLAFGGGAVASTMAFYGLNLIQLFFLFSARLEGNAFRSNPFKNLWQVLALGVGGVFLALMAVTPFGKVIGLVNLNLVHWLVVLGMSFAVFPIAELCKLARRIWTKRQAKKQFQTK